MLLMLMVITCIGFKVAIIKNKWCRVVFVIVDRVWHKISFSFYIGYCTNVKVSSFTDYFTHSWRKKSCIHDFPKGITTNHPVIWGCRIHRLHLCRGVRHLLTYTHQWVSWYDIKQSDGEPPVMLDLWGMWSTLLLSLIPDPLWPGVVAPGRVLSMSWIEMFDHLSVYKQMTDV